MAPRTGARARGLARLAATATALVIGVAIGCLGDLPRGRSCGDGWWDPEHEECDPTSKDRSWVEACRDDGFVRDAECDPVTCELRASEMDCSECGDGIASGTEECDGDDLRGSACPGGSGVVRCTDQCTLDFEQCPAVCGDGIVSGIEECEPSLSCASDEDCGEGRVCYQLLGECVPSNGGFSPNLSCSYYDTTAIGTNRIIDKPYVSGNIWRCTDECLFGRNDCGFCGDGVRDGAYVDVVHPGGSVAPFPGEFCDGKDALQEDIEAYCQPLCVKEAINADVVVLCDVQCNDKCTGFAPPEDIVPNPESLGCCLAPKSPCPRNDPPPPGVPDLPCCSWLSNPDWLEAKKCVEKDTNAVPVSYLCP
ncbi:MAG: hypothetical protein R6X02_33500 [Enhygromyxa sp.]